jgi:hypothetical protein
MRANGDISLGLSSTTCEGFFFKPISGYDFWA